MIIGLTGYAQSGKDTVASILVEKYGFRRIAFADPIRTFCYDFNPVIGHVANEDILLRNVVDRDGWEKAKQSPGVRRLLQNVGVAARNTFGEYFWVVQALTGVESGENVVIPDVRFINEADFIKTYDDSHIWRVQRLGVEAVNSHVSESQMDEYNVDQTLVNNGTLEELELLIKTRMRAYV